MKKPLAKILSEGTTPRKSRKIQKQDSDYPPLECDLASETAADATPPALTLTQSIVAGLNGRRNPKSLRAVRRLVALAADAIHQLESLSNEGNPWIALVARDRIDWPVLTGHHHGFLQKNADLIDRIQLGQNTRNRIILAQLPVRRTNARTQTIRLLDLMCHVQDSAVWGESIHTDVSECDESFLKRLSLPLRQYSSTPNFEKFILTWPLVLKIKLLPILGPEEETVKAWQSVALELLYLNCADNPASIPELFPLGEHKRFHPYPKSLDRDILDELVPEDKQSKNISREIRDILKDEIRKIGNEVGKVKKIPIVRMKRGGKRAITQSSQKSA